MSDSVGLVSAVAIAEVIPAAIYLYAAYWAFGVRRALGGKLYRSHALWLGVVGVVGASYGFLTYSTNLILQEAIAVYVSALFLFVFAFIDATMPVLRRSDPLLRSILRWDRLRIPLWCGVALAAVLTYLSYLYYYNSSVGLTPTNPVIGFIESVGWSIPASVAFGISAAALVIGTRRSADPVLKTSLKWLGLVLILFVLSFLVTTIEGFILPPTVTQFEFFYSYYVLPSGLVGIASAYCLYRSARSLAPLNRILVEP
jgi:hypothetical protein